MALVIGNWKSNKNSQETVEWFTQISTLFSQKKPELKDIEIVVCPAFVHLSLAKSLITKYHLSLKLGAQDVSPFEAGSFTGEINARQLRELTEFVIIGHSERRDKFKEDDALLTAKGERAKEAGLKVIFCVPDSKTPVFDKADIIAYEPVWAIGTGKAESPQAAQGVCRLLKKKYPQSQIIYGGSVNDKNIADFIRMEFIDGVLPGKASLDALLFFEMILNASR